MKRFVLIPKILLPLVLLAAFFLPGCTIQATNKTEVSKGTVVVGEEARLSVSSEWHDNLGCDSSYGVTVSPGNLFGWSVEPSNGAAVINGVFVASKPGTYVVSPKSGPNIKQEGPVEGGQEKVITNMPVTIVVKGTAAEDNSAETTAAAATTTKPSDTNNTNTETNETTTETDATSAEADANLMHGVVPTKVTVHVHFATDNEDSYGDTYIEFWNVGELGGEQYAKAKGHWVATTDGVQSSETTFEGTFTGGPNGIIDMTSTSSSGLAEGTTSKMVIQLVDGKQMENPSNGYILQIDNPEAFAEAFNGWKD